MRNRSLTVAALISFSSKFRGRKRSSSGQAGRPVLRYLIWTVTPVWLPTPSAYSARRAGPLGTDRGTMMLTW